ncbi:hypothetical protein [Paraburkholderia sp. BCC1876]|uniref:hypothetical protein n=1 Tax=Paraburkholderia sp. BCC1876 TaxID=2676303 RepID=UPI0015913A4C|nr:hypothetical protein [Paraburkholderia sp. BCC1876]
MEEERNTHGGARAGSGRKAFNPDGGETPIRKVRLSDEAWEKATALGKAADPKGSASTWIRQQIEDAPDPRDTKKRRK